MNYIINYMKIDELKQIDKNIVNSDSESELKRNVFCEIILVKRNNVYFDLVPCIHKQKCRTESSSCFKGTGDLVRCYIVEYADIVEIVAYQEFKKRYTI